MKWSKFNYMLDSKKYGYFIYNSSTNSFLKVSKPIFSQISSIKDWDSGINIFTKDFQEILRTHKIIVEDHYDDDLFNILKYRMYSVCFGESILSLTIATTTNCNFKCPYCYEAGIKNINMDQNTEDAIIKFISDYEMVDITWYGGEPLLNYESIVRLTNRIAKLNNVKRISYSMVTNGYYLDEEKCKFFAANNLGSVQVTIDGTEKVHNRSRISKSGKPSFYTILENIDRGLELMPQTRFIIRVNLGMDNKDDFPSLYRQLMRRWRGYDNFSIYMSYIEDYDVCNGTSFFQSVDKMLYLKHLADKEKIYPNQVKLTPQLNCCVANSKNGYVISANGDLYKCWSDIGKEERKVGTVFAPKKRTNHRLLAEYSIKLSKFEDPKCMKCFLLPVCDGGCPFHKYENIYNKGHHEICPYQLDNIDLTLEWMYELYLIKEEYLSKAKTLVR